MRIVFEEDADLLRRMERRYQRREEWARRNTGNHSSQYSAAAEVGGRQRTHGRDRRYRRPGSLARRGGWNRTKRGTFSPGEGAKRRWYGNGTGKGDGQRK